MPSPSLKLDLERVLKSHIQEGLNLFAGKRPVHAAHETDNDLTGTFLNIIASDPNWEDMIINAILRLTFEFSTNVADPDSRKTAATQHGEDMGRLIELFSDQKFNETRDALDAVRADELGFTGWEAIEPPEPDGTLGKDMRSRLNYDFIVYLKS